MMIFADSANLDELLQVSSVINGVTTNPNLLKDDLQTAIQISSIMKCKVSYQLSNYNEFLKQIDSVFQHKDKIILKVPMCTKYFQHAKPFITSGLDVNATLVFNINQAILAANLGAKYVSIFVGRLEDNDQLPFEVIEEVRMIYDSNNIQTQIIAASIRNVEHVEKAAIAGAHISTVPIKIIKQLFEHQLTECGMTNFAK